MRSDPWRAGLGSFTHMMGMALQTTPPRSHVLSFKQTRQILSNRHSSGRGVLIKPALKSDWTITEPQFASHCSTDLYSVKKTESLWQLLPRAGRLTKTLSGTKPPWS